MVSLPLTVLNSPAVTHRGQPTFGTASDILGIIIWVIGWLIESIADVQKVRPIRPFILTGVIHCAHLLPSSNTNHRVLLRIDPST